MSYDWGPRYIIPSEVIETYSEDLLGKELVALGILGPIVDITNPWYYRRKNTDTWVKIGESNDKQGNFPMRWDTTSLEDGEYEVMGLMHVAALKGNTGVAIARQNIVEVTVKN
jgi:hypothetical protein